MRQEQAGFWKGMSCRDHIFTLRQIPEQNKQWNSTVYVNFIDFEKAFDKCGTIRKKRDPVDFCKHARRPGFRRRHIDIQAKTRDLATTAETIGLKINIPKTKLMRMNTKSNESNILHGEKLQ
ncbi:uncharacterized protein LOC121370088 [Gigantopelta aegis]|uniref:uncharacterized protein LOC121370088 n=1 Tax=Gigantopelta aegis TaxID=1735272 RepID=UPI001B88B3B4|nr:uncharacterized protein LOC121370088 [Gigantopelta aegis]